jgi:hypothetical protein
MRASRASVMRPKLLAGTAVSGLFDSVRLRMLNNPARYLQPQALADGEYLAIGASAGCLDQVRAAVQEGLGR